MYYDYRDNKLALSRDEVKQIISENLEYIECRWGNIGRQRCDSITRIPLFFQIGTFWSHEHNERGYKWEMLGGAGVENSGTDHAYFLNLHDFMLHLSRFRRR